MPISSHRYKAMEKRILRKVIISLSIAILAIVLLVFVGLPLLSRFIFLISPKSNSSSQNETVDSAVLFPPTMNPSFEATNSAPISISGYSEKQAKVRILVNGKEKTTTDTDKDGKFSVDRLALEDGDNAIAAILLKDKKESPASAPLHVLYKKSPPKLEISSPKDGDKFSDSKDISITGTTDPDSRVTINNRFVIVDNQGRFSYAVSLSQGDTMFKVVTTDTAGNQTTKELKVNYSP